MALDVEYSGSESQPRPHRHHHHRRGRKGGTPSAGGSKEYTSDDVQEIGDTIAKWRHEAHVKDHEIRLLRKMVESAKAEIHKKERAVANLAERIPSFRNEGQGFSKEALDMIETLERKLSEREYQSLKMQQDLESAQAAVTERNERIHDLCLQWEKSTALLKEARERDLAALHKRLRHLEEDVIPGLRSRAEAAEAREKQLRNELTVANARIKQVEAMAQERLAQKERALAEAHRRVHELELDMEHVMAAAARYTRRDVLVEHLGTSLQNVQQAGPAPSPSPAPASLPGGAAAPSPFGAADAFAGAPAAAAQAAFNPPSATMDFGRATPATSLGMGSNPPTSNPLTNPGNAFATPAMPQPSAGPSPASSSALFPIQEAAGSDPNGASTNAYADLSPPTAALPPPLPPSQPGSEPKRYSFQNIPEDNPRHRLSVIMRKLKPSNFSSPSAGMEAQY